MRLISFHNGVPTTPSTIAKANSFEVVTGTVPIDDQCIRSPANNEDFGELESELEDEFSSPYTDSNYMIQKKPFYIYMVEGRKSC
jgi:hypothetical protein